MSRRATYSLGLAPSSVGLVLILTAMFGSGCAHTPRPNLVGRVVNPRGYAIVGARVSLSGRTEEAVTGSDGRFRFKPLPQGTYALSVSSYNQDVRFRDSTRVRNGRLTEVELTLPDVMTLGYFWPKMKASQATGVIRGVLESENASTLEYAYVIVDQGPMYVHADSSGHFLIGGVAVGAHTLHAKMDGCEPAHRESIAVSEGDTTTVNFKLRRAIKSGTGTILGRVVSEEGMPLQYASVFVVGTQTGGQTDREGKVLIHHVPIGAYTIRVRMVGYAMQERMGTHVIEGDTTTVRFQLHSEPVELKY